MIIGQNYEKNIFSAIRGVANRYVRVFVCVSVRNDFELGATGTRQIWWVCKELNSKTSDRAIFELAHLFAEL